MFLVPPIKGDGVRENSMIFLSNVAIFVKRFVVRFVLKKLILKSSFLRVLVDGPPVSLPPPLFALSTSSLPPRSGSVHMNEPLLALSCAPNNKILCLASCTSFVPWSFHANDAFHKRSCPSLSNPPQSTHPCPLGGGLFHARFGFWKLFHAFHTFSLRSEQISNISGFSSKSWSLYFGSCCPIF